jgi:hypothetical protein
MVEIALPRSGHLTIMMLKASVDLTVVKDHVVDAVVAIEEAKDDLPQTPAELISPPSLGLFLPRSLIDSMRRDFGSNATIRVIVSPGV